MVRSLVNEFETARWLAIINGILLSPLIAFFWIVFGYYFGSWLIVHIR